MKFLVCLFWEMSRHIQCMWRREHMALCMVNHDRSCLLIFYYSFTQSSQTYSIYDFICQPQLTLSVTMWIKQWDKSGCEVWNFGIVTLKWSSAAVMIPPPFFLPSGMWIQGWVFFDVNKGKILFSHQEDPNDVRNTGQTSWKILGSLKCEDIILAKNYVQFWTLIWELNLWPNL